MTKQKKTLLRAVALCLLVCLCVSIVACAKQDADETESTGKETVTYTVTVNSQGGQPLAGVSVYIYTDATRAELVWVEKTDDEGKMTFKDVTCEGYVAVLTGVPTGYEVEETYPITGETTRIVLTSMLGEEGDLTTVTYQLGDVMNDFSVTAPDGTVYTLSGLLAEKEAVVLNFWYLECGPCKSEFPYLQEAYQQYSDKIEVLALNPVNSDPAEVAAFQADNGYTFPMMLCDESWVAAMQLTAYPTTVVIDRYGTITLIHKGAVTEAETFENIFAFFSSDEYEQTIVKDVEELPAAQEETGSAENPIELGATPSFTVTVDPGQVVYLNIYRVTGQYLQIQHADAYIIYKGNTYTASNGKVGVSLVTDEAISMASLGIGNSGTETQTFTVTMGFAQGSYSNPYPMELGEFTARVSAGNDQGVYYKYKATEDGYLTVECLSATAGIAYDLVLYNLNTYAYRTLGSDGNKNTITVKVRAGDTVTFIAGALPDDSGSYPAAAFTLRASLGDGSDLNIEPEVEKITYAITVTDENRTPVSGAQIYLVVDGQTTTISTNANGVASTKLPVGTYTATLKVPAGYTARNTVFRLTEAIPTISVKVDAVETATYTITVVDENGTPIQGALVNLGESSGRTDASGKVSFTTAKAGYTISVSASGYAFASEQLDANTAALTVTLTQGAVEGIDYTVHVVDYFGTPMTGVTVNFLSNGAIVGMADVDASGTAVAQLVPGDYTVTVSSCYTDAAKAVLSESAPTAAITAVKKCGTEFEAKQDYELYHVDEGATYAELSTVLVNGEDVVDNFFLFVPEQSGLYRFTTTDPNAVISYWGTTAFIYSSTPDSYANNSFTVNIKDALVENEVGFVVGVTGSSNCILLITRIGDPEMTVEDYPWSTGWQTGQTPSKTYTVTDRGTLTYVDITAATSAYTPVYNESDGYYHLGSVSGPVIMVRLDADAPYLSFQTMLESTGVKCYFYDDAGNFLKKEDYTDYMLACVQYMNTTYGTYPLTKDLKYILEGYGAFAGWYDIDSPGYLFTTTVVNEEIAWMFACCYLK